jgi:hypothetical protein
MRFLLLLLVLLVVSGCDLFSFDRESGTPLVSRCQDLGTGRGVVAEFINDNDRLREGFDFSLNIKLANYFENSPFMEVYVDDNVDLLGFPREGITHQLDIEPAIVDFDVYQSPGCRISGGGSTTYTLGRYVYSTLPDQAEHSIRFNGVLKYQGFTEAMFSYCLTNKDQVPTPSCRNNLNLGWKNAKAPVAVTSVDSRSVYYDESEEGDLIEEFVVLIDIENLGGGFIPAPIGEPALDFKLESVPNIGFECESAQAEERGSNDRLTLILDDEKAHIECSTFVSIDREIPLSFEVELTYPYEYLFFYPALGSKPLPLYPHGVVPSNRFT